MPATIKVLVVDDSALIRQMLTRALSLDPRIEIVGVAKNGLEAVEKATRLQPDVVTLDIEMPELNGLEALRFIVKSAPSRVIMLSSLDDPDVTYEALSNGAIDFITKPTGGMASSLTDLTDVLLKKIRTAYRVEPEKRLSSQALGDGQIPAPAASGAAVSPPSGVREAETKSGAPEKLVVIAASTGGPPALETVFRGLSPDLPASFLIVQHLPPGFSASLANRLSKVSAMPVSEARGGMPLARGAAYIAPCGQHMLVAPGTKVTPRVALDDGPPLHGVRPAADPLMQSAARAFGDKVVGVVLTGMGSDGAEGLVAVQARGGDTIAQDEATSVVWGMPGAALKKGAVRRVVPLDLIAAEIRMAVRGRP